MKTGPVIDMADADAGGRSVILPTGRLDIHVEEAVWPLDALCAFAARENPRRGFLVVSRVLGRHIPTDPRTMRLSVRDLVSRIPADLPGPVLVVGLAETAVCLGQTIHDALRAGGRDDAHFLHTTRQRIDHPLLCRFDEPHSHASAHLIYRPELPTPRSLILVDDEISTGTTLTNLADALAAVWPKIETIVVATLTDWSRGVDWPTRMKRPTQVVSLLAGRLEWTQGTTLAADAAFDATAASLGRMTPHRNFGRLGLSTPIALPPDTPLPLVTGPLRIVGTGEFTYLPFRLAERLAEAGRDVVVQATSRSPARIGGAILSRLRFEDNYATGVPNFLYNADPDDGRVTWLTHETGAATLDPALLAALDATPIGWTR